METAPATKTGSKRGIILHRCIPTMSGTNCPHTRSMTIEDVGIFGLCVAGWRAEGNGS